MNKQVESKKTDKITAGKLRYNRDKDREKVKGVFQYFELPGGELNFWFRKYKEDPIERYDLKDGKMYSLPLGVARHLNKNGKYPVHSHQIEEDGRASQLVGKKVSRFGFRSLEFMSIEDLAECEPEVIISDTRIG